MSRPGRWGLGALCLVQLLCCACEPKAAVGPAKVAQSAGAKPAFPPAVSSAPRDVSNCQPLTISGPNILICSERSLDSAGVETTRTTVLDVCSGTRSALFEITDVSRAACRSDWRDRVWALGSQTWLQASNSLTWAFVMYESDMGDWHAEACGSRVRHPTDEGFLALTLNGSSLHALHFTVADDSITLAEESRTLLKRFGGDAHKVTVASCSDAAQRLSSATGERTDGL